MLPKILKHADEKLKDLEDIDICFQESSVVSCLADAVEPISDLDLDVTTAEQCAVLGSAIEAQLRCMKECDRFSCETDAETLIVGIGTGLAHELECGGIDYEATCNTEVLAINDAPAMIPSECLDDPAIRECRDKITSEGFECQDTAQELVDDYVCLSECETFDCTSLRAFFDLLETSFAGGECGRIDLEESCNLGQVVGAAGGVKVGTMIFVAIGAMVIRMLH